MFSEIINGLPQLLYPQEKKSRYPLDQKMAKTQSLSEHGGKGKKKSLHCLRLQRIETMVVQPIT